MQQASRGFQKDSNGSLDPYKTEGTKRPEVMEKPMSLEIYLDNSATTRCDKEVANLVTECMLEDYANPSSAHRKGFEAEKRVKQAAERIAETLKVLPREILFTSGATESDNMALIGCAHALEKSPIFRLILLAESALQI